MEKLNITSKVLDKLGFSEYWDEHGTWGGRMLKFKNNVQFRIIEQDEMDDIHEGYASMSNDIPTYVANYFRFEGWFAIPKLKCNCYDLYFLHEMYICIEEEYPENLIEFVEICKNNNMSFYIDSYLSSLN